MIMFPTQDIAEVVSTVVLVKDGDSLTNETLTHGTDNDGKTYRTIIKFDLEPYSESTCIFSILCFLINLFQ